MARQERAIRTRRAILEAAAAVFDEHGYEAATIADILERAKVTKGALYFHFSSKRELAEGILEEQFAEASAPPQEYRMQEVADAGLLLAYRMRRNPLLSAGARLSLGAGMRETFGGGSVPGWIAFTERQLTQAKEQGELLTHVDPARTAWILSACWAGAQVYSQTLVDRTDLEARVADVYGHIFPSIVTPAILARLDLSPDRGGRLFTETTRTAAPEPQASHS